MVERDGVGRPHATTDSHDARPDTSEPRSTRALVELLEAVRDGACLWELVPDGVVSARERLRGPGGQVHVQRSPVELELALDDEPERAVARLRRRGRTIELTREQLRIIDRSDARPIAWSDLVVSGGTMDFIEEHRVSDDAHRVATVVEPAGRWHRRRQFPIVRYGAVRARAKGFRVVWLSSSVDAAQALLRALVAAGARQA